MYACMCEAGCPRPLLVPYGGFGAPICGRKRCLGFLGGFNWDLFVNWKMVSSPNCVFGGRNVPLLAAFAFGVF
jgi:hypothetical protein